MLAWPSPASTVPGQRRPGRKQLQFIAFIVHVSGGEIKGMQSGLDLIHIPDH
ncbi:MAG: hypothetical protein IIB14_06695 [Chloroflexi bacterium]|nr:hypothetical protein [Chloroflexota bacterium]